MLNSRSSDVAAAVDSGKETLVTAKTRSGCGLPHHQLVLRIHSVYMVRLEVIENV